MTRLCHLVEFALFGICRTLVGSLPLAGVRRAGTLLGDLVWWIARSSFRSLGGAACDTLHAMAEADEPLRARMRLEGGEVIGLEQRPAVHHEKGFLRTGAPRMAVRAAISLPAIPGRSVSPRSRSFAQTG